MIRKLIILSAFSMFCALSNAQSNMPSALDQLATQCQQVIEFNDAINARQAKLDELKNQLDIIKQNWWQICNDALSSPECDENDIRLSTIDELIRLTDPKFEAELFAQLKEARNNAAIRKLNPMSQPTSANGRGNSSSLRNTSRNDNTPPTKEKSTKAAQKREDDSNVKGKDEVKDKDVAPITEEQSKDEQDVKKDNKSTSPESKDSKKNPEKQVVPEQQEKKEQKDKTKIESKDETNRNKTINAVKDKLNKNK